MWIVHPERRAVHLGDVEIGLITTLALPRLFDITWLHATLPEVARDTMLECVSLILALQAKAAELNAAVQHLKDNAIASEAKAIKRWVDLLAQGVTMTDIYK
jgi:hypothetical protein